MWYTINMQARKSTSAIEVLIGCAGFLVILAGMLALVYGFWWVALWALSQLLAWFGVVGFPKDFPWWMPLVLALVTSLLAHPFKIVKKSSPS